MFPISNLTFPDCVFHLSHVSENAKKQIDHAIKTGNTQMGVRQLLGFVAYEEYYLYLVNYLTSFEETLDIDILFKTMRDVIVNPPNSVIRFALSFVSEKMFEKLAKSGIFASPSNGGIRFPPGYNATFSIGAMTLLETVGNPKMVKRFLQKPRKLPVSLTYEILDHSVRTIVSIAEDGYASDSDDEDEDPDGTVAIANLLSHVDPSYSPEEEQGIQKFVEKYPQYRSMIPAYASS